LFGTLNPQVDIFKCTNVNVLTIEKIYNTESISEVQTLEKLILHHTAQQRVTCLNGVISAGGVEEVGSFQCSVGYNLQCDIEL
jgi:hypothetical protein